MNASGTDLYLKRIKLEELLVELSPFDLGPIINGIAHFTEKEADKRDKIVLDYFGEEGATSITDSIVRFLLLAPELDVDADILDVGAGSGFYTLRVMKKIHQTLPGASFYAIDVAPLMLRILSQKTGQVIPFIGIAENIAGSVERAKKFLDLPEKFNAIFSTLMLHHSPHPEMVFKSLSESLDYSGKAVIIDLCEHPFQEFKEEMGDIHLGFDPKYVEETAGKFFPHVCVDKIPGIRCESTGRTAELFIAYMYNNPLDR